LPLSIVPSFTHPLFHFFFTAFADNYRSFPHNDLSASSAVS